MGKTETGWKLWFLSWSKVRRFLFSLSALYLLILSALVLLIKWFEWGRAPVEAYLVLRAFTLLRGYEILCVLWVTFELPMAEYPLSVVDLLSLVETYIGSQILFTGERLPLFFIIN